LIDIFGEIKRVLKDEGTAWVNIGDTYASTGQCVEPKSLCGIPERLALAMTDRLGYIRRNTIIWHKSNVLPSSVKDRFTVDFEYVYFFSKNPIYYFEQQLEDAIIGYRSTSFIPDSYKDSVSPAPTSATNASSKNRTDTLVTKRNKRCVWNINTKPFKEAHFAVFPEELVQTPVLACVPEHICNKCGKAREKVYDNSERHNTRPGKNVLTGKSGTCDNPNYSLHKSDLSKYRQQLVYKSIEYTDCGCGAGFHPGIVLDPFMGSGTTALVALKLNRNFVGIELNPEYIKIAENRIRSEREKQSLF